MTQDQIDHVLRTMKRFVRLAGNLRSVLAEAEASGVIKGTTRYNGQYYHKKQDTLGRPAPFRPPEMNELKKCGLELSAALWDVTKG